MVLFVQYKYFISVSHVGVLLHEGTFIDRDRSQSLCILRACFRTPSVLTYRFVQPGNPQRYRAFAGTTGLCFMRG